MHPDQPREDGAAAEVEALRAGRRFGRDLPIDDHHRLVLAHRPARAVDEADVLQHQRLRLHLDERLQRDGGGEQEGEDHRWTYPFTSQGWQGSEEEAAARKSVTAHHGIEPIHTQFVEGHCFAVGEGPQSEPVTNDSR